MNIPDPSDYRYGDEQDPRSPYFNGPDNEPRYSIVTDTFVGWYVYDENGEEVTDKGQIDFSLEYEVEEDRKGNIEPGKTVEFKISEIRVKDEKFASVEEAEKKYPGNFKLKDIQEVIEDDFKKVS